MRLQPFSQLTARPISWLWPGRLALGKLAMLDGDPGLGKSLLALDLCARLSTGRPFPGEVHADPPANALVFNAEDSPTDTIRPRLAALGADLERVFVLQSEDTLLAQPLRLPGQTSLLESALVRTRARLVVLDPVVAFLDASVCASNDRGVRRALGPLAHLAQTHECVMLLLRHLTKRAGAQALYRGSGSIGFVGACRSGWLLARDPESSDCRVLAPVKNNLAPPQPSLAFALRTEDGPHPRLEWLGPSPWTADQLLARDTPGTPAAPRDRAVLFLTGFLRDGPRTSADVWAAARPQGLSKRTLYRARRELQVRIHRIDEGRTRLNYWLLPDQHLPPTVSAEDDLQPWLASLRAQFPPSTPLDDF